ncbi:MAG: sugar-binding transcriptional regulator [Pseudomonadota bacterium]
MASRAAWLSYVGGYRQEDIATRLGISRVKVNRLIALAHRRGFIRVFVEGRAVECVALEDEIAERFGLALCQVLPSVGHDDLPLETLAAGGAHFLLKALERPELELVGIGHGRTLAATVDRLPRLPRSQARFVSLLGCLTRNAAANPFDVIHRLAEKAGAEAYFMPVPFFANSVADKQVLMAQESLTDVFALASDAQLYVVGIGEISSKAHMLDTGMITRAEFAELSGAGAVGEVLGQFVDANGQPVEAPLNERAIGVKLAELKGKEVVAIAGGHGKARAIRAVLNSGTITGLITDEATAKRIVDSDVENGATRNGPTGLAPVPAS